MSSFFTKNSKPFTEADGSFVLANGSLVLADGSHRLIALLRKTSLIFLILASSIIITGCGDHHGHHHDDDNNYDNYFKNEGGGIIVIKNDYVETIYECVITYNAYGAIPIQFILPTTQSGISPGDTMSVEVLGLELNGISFSQLLENKMRCKSSSSNSMVWAKYNPTEKAFTGFTK